MSGAEAIPEPGWIPSPVDTSGIELPAELVPLIERLAENAHDNWGKLRLSERKPGAKRHPLLKPYAELSEDEKDADRVLAVETLKLAIFFGFRIVPGE